MKQDAKAPKQRRAAGFTLIEMLVAIALLAVIAVLSWRGLSATIRGRDDVVSSLTQTRMLGRYFSQLQYDMSSLVTADEVYGPPLRILPNELVLVRHLAIGDGTTSLQVVRYQLKEHQLRRSASPPVSSLSKLIEELHHMDEFASVVASDDVRSMNLSVWIQPGGWTSSQSEVASAYARFLAQHNVSTGSTLRMPLPRGIQFSITLGATGSKFTRVIPLGG
jgi:general secretion pathway protein J